MKHFTKAAKQKSGIRSTSVECRIKMLRRLIFRFVTYMMSAIQIADTLFEDMNQPCRDTRELETDLLRDQTNHITQLASTSKSIIGIRNTFLRSKGGRKVVNAQILFLIFAEMNGFCEEDAARDL